ncbi:MAG: beta-Ig-H3/fasciclin [Parcubacteria group bacterium Gr01-1014_56]|nr:MAG: beta-Ig-H3/fasciclin [Parcubacteria group bacterium Gr01-1014_56]
MDSQNNITKWVIGAVVVLALVLGLWWFMGTQSTTQPVVTTSTSETSGPGQVTITTTSSDVAAVVASISNGGTFASYLSSTGVGATLTGKGPYTVFVSTDGAFSRLTPGTISALSAAELKRMAQYHIVVGKRLDVDAISSGQIQALSKDTLNFQVDTTKGAVYVNSGYVLKAYKATNGIVYVINSVLLPPKPTP